MMRAVHLDHVALLVRSIETVSGRLDCPPEFLRAIERFPREGTRERYVGPPEATAALLLIEPATAGGPYGTALRKRGAGLHHVAVRTPDARAYVGALGGSGWFLLPQSLRSLEDSRTAWLGRPGIPFLVEVIEGIPNDGPPVVSLVELPVGGLERLLRSLAPAADPLAGLQASADGGTWVTIGARRHSVADLVADT
jgi:hypothetical protein